jgi:hypothetical protein
VTVLPPSYDDSAAGGYHKPRADLYTVLLMVALLALVVGAVFLFLEAADYGPTPAGRPTVQTSFYQPSPVAPLTAGFTAAVASQFREFNHG